MLGVSRFLIGRDTRESGPRIEAALAAGLMDEGCEVELLGVLPTPAVAYLSHTRGLPAAMISASHNVFSDNGIKIFSGTGRKLADEIESRIAAEISSGPGSSSAASPADRSAAGHSDYLLHLEDALERRRLDGLRIVVDCAHGAAFEVAPEILERLGAVVEVLSAEPDGRNINADCGSTHPRRVSEAVVRSEADVGLAYDGDADRLVAVDETGGLVDGDHLLAVAALDLRDRGRLSRDTIVTTVLANLGLRRAMAEHAISVVETRVGDRYVFEAMEEGGFSLGGEQSGHVIFADLATTGDGVLSGLVLLDVMRRSGTPLSRLASVVTKLPQVLLNVAVADRDGLERADAFWAAVGAVEGELGDAGRVLVRPSGTEPVVRIMVEAATEEVARAAASRLGETLVGTLGPPEVGAGRR